MSLLFYVCFFLCFNKFLSDALLEVTHRQPVDHLGFGKQSMTYFQQRIWIDYKHNADGHTIRDGTPLLVYICGESSLEDSPIDSGIVKMAADKLQAIIIYIEHRFYGKSVPLGSIDLAMNDPEIRGCLNTQQALADVADVIAERKKNYSSPNSPVIVFGGSYSGMLAAWFRLKYPHLAVGALASSAPILNYENLPQEKKYCSIVSNDFKAEDEKCYERISRSWKMIDDIGTKHNGLGRLSKAFNTCEPLDSTSTLKHYLVLKYYHAAQYNGRFNGLLGDLCGQIIKAPEEDVVEGIGRGVLLMTSSQNCIDLYLDPATGRSIYDAASTKAWDWQVCSELMSHNDDCETTMFENSPISLSTLIDGCYGKYNVYPRLKGVSTYYGGQDIKSALKNFGSNLIFSNGLKDPYSGASIQEDISNTIVAITTEKGSHCLDVLPAKSDDPRWLRNQRKKELKILVRWVKDAQSSNPRLVVLGWLQIFVSVVVLLHLVGL